MVQNIIEIELSTNTVPKDFLTRRQVGLSNSNASRARAFSAALNLNSHRSELGADIRTLGINLNGFMKGYLAVDT